MHCLLLTFPFFIFLSCLSFSTAPFFFPIFISTRIGCGMMVLFCFLLPNLQSGEHEVENVIISTANTVRSIGTFSLRGSALKSHTYAPETVHNGVRAAIFGLPHDSPMALLLPSLYLAGAGELLVHSKPPKTIIASRIFRDLFYGLMVLIILRKNS